MDGGAGVWQRRGVATGTSTRSTFAARVAKANAPPGLAGPGCGSAAELRQGRLHEAHSPRASQRRTPRHGWRGRGVAAPWCCDRDVYAKHFRRSRRKGERPAMDGGAGVWQRRGVATGTSTRSTFAARVAKANAPPWMAGPGCGSAVVLRQGRLREALSPLASQRRTPRHGWRGRGMAAPRCCDRGRLREALSPLASQRRTRSAPRL